MRYVVRVEGIILKRLGWRGTVTKDGWIAKNRTHAVETLANALKFTSRADADSMAVVFVVKRPDFIGKVSVREICWHGNVMRTKEA